MICGARVIVTAAPTGLGAAFAVTLPPGGPVVGPICWCLSEELANRIAAAINFEDAVHELLIDRGRHGG